MTRPITPSACQHCNTPEEPTMSKLHAAMTFARTAVDHPFTITETGGERHFEWACPEECGDDPCPMIRRIRDADLYDLADHLPAGDYLAVPTLWSVDLTHLDGTPVDEAGAA